MEGGEKTNLYKIVPNWSPYPVEIFWKIDLGFQNCVYISLLQKVLAISQLIHISIKKFLSNIGTSCKLLKLEDTEWNQENYWLSWH